MSCPFSKDLLALHVQGDLPPAAADRTARHLDTCDECRRFFEQLQAGQLLLRALRREPVSPAECTRMRCGVMSIISERRARPGWALRIERAILLGVRQHAYAMAALVLVGIVSVSVVAHSRRATPEATGSAAVFVSGDTLLRPEGYRDWILVGRPAGPHGSGVRGTDPAASAPAHRVYIDPSGYRGYATTGSFPEGTLMVWESVSLEPMTVDRPQPGAPVVLLASVKDSARFDGGWGFFDFTSRGGAAPQITARPASSGCRKCHRQDAATDHVFTQLYEAMGLRLLMSPRSPLARSQSLSPRFARLGPLCGQAQRARNPCSGPHSGPGLRSARHRAPPAPAPRFAAIT